RNVTGSSLAIEDAFRKAGFPKHLFRSIIIEHELMPEVLASRHIHAGSLTGSERAGAAFASAAGQALKKVVMELGGSDPCIIFDDADIALAAKVAAKARMMNAGQVCIAAKRILVQKSVQEEFTKCF